MFLLSLGFSRPGAVETGYASEVVNTTNGNNGVGLSSVPRVFNSSEPTTFDRLVPTCAHSLMT